MHTVAVHQLTNVADRSRRRCVPIELFDFDQKDCLVSSFSVRLKYPLVIIATDSLRIVRLLDQLLPDLAAATVSSQQNFAAVGLRTHVNNNNMDVWMLHGVFRSDDKAKECFSHASLVVPKCVFITISGLWKYRRKMTNPSAKSPKTKRILLRFGNHRALNAYSDLSRKIGRAKSFRPKPILKVSNGFIQNAISNHLDASLAE